MQIFYETSNQTGDVFTKKVPNKHLSDIISRVEKKYGIDSAELDDEALGWVSAAGEQNIPPSKKEDEDE